ncbi:MAG: hypothetical protein KDD62_09445, partial [Bdellovibrionales bacterium]|nr:hypothetical protein [Bdellovibrionales bacterium]
VSDRGVFMEHQTVFVLEEPVDIENPLGELSFPDRHPNIATVGILNFEVNFCEQEDSTDVGLVVKDSADRKLGEIRFTHVSHNDCADFVEYLIHPDQNNTELYRVLQQSNGDKLAVNGKWKVPTSSTKANFFSGNWIRTIIEEAQRLGISMSFHLEKERFSSPHELATIYKARLGNTNLFVCGEVGQREFIGAYERRVDVVGLSNGRKKELVEYYLKQPSVQAMELGDNKMNMLPVAELEPLAVLDTSAERIRWIHITNPNREMALEIAERLQAPHSIVLDMERDDRVAHHSEEDGFLLIGQHVLGVSKKGDLLEQEIDFFMKGNLLVSVSLQEIPTLSVAMTRLGREEGLTPKSVGELYFEIAYDISVNNRNIPSQMQEPVSKLFRTVVNRPLATHPKLRDQVFRATDKLVRMQKVFSGQDVLLKAVEAYEAHDESRVLSKRALKLQELMHIDLADLDQTINRQLSLLKEIQETKRTAHASLLTKVVSTLGGISLVLSISPWINNQLAIVNPAFASLALALTGGATFLLARRFTQLFKYSDREFSSNSLLEAAPNAERQNA